MSGRCGISLYFFFNDTATTEIYTLSLHDALPISSMQASKKCLAVAVAVAASTTSGGESVSVATAASRSPSILERWKWVRSEEHTSELQSRQYLVCRLLLEKKKKNDRR